MPDIYIRDENDTNFDPDRVEVEDPLSMFLQELIMLFDTRRTEVLGEDLMGGSLDAMVHKLNFNGDQIKQEMKRQINLFSEMAKVFDYDIEVRFFRGTVEDIAAIDVLIDGSSVIGFSVK